jgi:DNA-directed RNA polymerase sigma subunit (sigma70/sigma32)
MAKRTSAHSTPIADQVEALAEALDDVGRAIDGSPDREAALQAASRLADLLREAADAAAVLRATVLLRIQEEQDLTLAELGALLGVSRARAGQLVQSARKARGPQASP